MTYQQLLRWIVLALIEGMYIPAARAEKMR